MYHSEVAAAVTFANTPGVSHITEKNWA
jgi:hypothetical protein